MIRPMTDNGHGSGDTVIAHATKVDADGEVADFWMRMHGELITATGRGTPPDAATLVDAEGRRLTPGFIDLHAHGGAGHSFDDGPEHIAAALELHRRCGTTRSVISLVANPLPLLERSLAGIAELAASDPLVLGSHLEGPYLAPARRGAHEVRHLRRPSIHEVAGLVAAAAGTLRQVTIAPELPDALAAIDALVEAGVVVAIGHTEADVEVSRQAFDRGASLLTHAFNAMPGFGHRAPGPVGAALTDDRVTLELIVDGRHVHGSVVEIAFRAAPGRVALVTDAMAATGVGDGDYALGALEVEVREGFARVAGTDTLAGSTVTLDASLRRAMRSGVSPVDAVRAVTLTPALALGLDHRFGLLTPGRAADAVMLDDAWSVRRVWAAGRSLR
ncbi:MAG: N-acetylglucosamine-6-phosphate deacetylase [Actinomycetota bacterium]